MSHAQVQPVCMSVLLHQNRGAWVAQGLDYDLAVQAPTVPLAKERFLRALRARMMDDVLDGREPLSTLGQAPPHYFDHLGGVKESGPEVPIYVPARRSGDANVTMSRLRAQFLEQDAA